MSAAADGGSPEARSGGDDGASREPALQVIVLGSGGGPMEFNTTSFLIRSIATGWSRGSVVALDAGVHLNAVRDILEKTLPRNLGAKDGEPLPYVIESGPFEGLEIPFASLSASAAHIQSTLIDTYLITHPHLDHIAGFVINTAGLPGLRPKRLAGLPATISAFKNHIFNNIIWPNLSDENNGAGLVTYMRLMEGGSPAFGDGEGKGYLEISDGLAVKIWGVSHGHCIERHSHRGSGASTRYNSIDASSMGLGNPGVMSPRIVAQHNASNLSLSQYLQQQQSQHSQRETQRETQPVTTTPTGPPRQSMSTIGSAGGTTGGTHSSPAESACVYDSSAYFVRDVATGREILVFGDVEPDSISLSPRNCLIWQEAAPKIASGSLAAIFIECSYDDSQTVDRLYGHLTPRFVIEEMLALAAEVDSARIAMAALMKEPRDGKKRKHGGQVDDETDRKRTSRASSQVPRRGASGDDPVSPKTVKPPRFTSNGPEELPKYTSTAGGEVTPHLATPTAELSLREAELTQSVVSSLPPPSPALNYPLRGLKVVIIHVKERLRDGPSAGEVILQELQEHEEVAKLGCEFIVSHPGQSLLL